MAARKRHRLLAYFRYQHLPEPQQLVSRPFCELAESIDEQFEGAEATTTLRKLLEAKDCAVRASFDERRPPED